MPRFEAFRHPLRRLPPRRPATRWIMGRSGVESEPGDNSERVAVPGVNRNPFARAPTAKGPEFLRAHRNGHEPRPGQRIGNSPGTIVGAVMKCLMPASVAIRFGAELVCGPDGAFHGSRGVHRRERLAIAQKRGVARRRRTGRREGAGGSAADRCSRDQNNAANKQFSKSNSHVYLNSASGVLAGFFFKNRRARQAQSSDATSARNGVWRGQGAARNALGNATRPASQRRVLSSFAGERLPFPGRD